jgi:hypothetical protein
MVLEKSYSGFFAQSATSRASSGVPGLKYLDITGFPRTNQDSAIKSVDIGSSAHAYRVPNTGGSMDNSTDVGILGENESAHFTFDTESKMWGEVFTIYGYYSNKFGCELELIIPLWIVNEIVNDKKRVDKTKKMYIIAVAFSGVV